MQIVGISRYHLSEAIEQLNIFCVNRMNTIKSNHCKSFQSVGSYLFPVMCTIKRPLMIKKTDQVIWMVLVVFCQLALLRTTRFFLCDWPITYICNFKTYLYRLLFNLIDMYIVCNKTSNYLSDSLEFTYTWGKLWPYHR